MKSPFAIFRKHQKMMMVVLVGLAMFAFIVMDSLQMTDRAGSSSSLLSIIAVIACAAAFWFLGRPSGNASTYAVAGALVGLVAALVIPSMFAVPAPYQTAMGNIDRKMLKELGDRRNRANQFLEAAFMKTTPMPDNPFLAQFYSQRLQGLMFGFGRSFEEDLVLGFLLSKEADEMGITLSDEAVSKYIKQATGDRLTTEDFRKIRSDLQLSESELYDAIREELRIRLAFVHVAPREVVTPEQYWDQYEKLTVRKELDVVAVPVKDFSSEIPDPANTELEGYFNQFRGIYPDDMNRPLSVDAFGQPRRVRVGYLVSEYNDELEASVAAVTDADVEKYYNDNKERYRNRREIDDESPAETPQGPSLPLNSPDPPATPDTEKKADESTPEPESKSATPPAEGKKSSEPEKNADPGQAANSLAPAGLIAQASADIRTNAEILLAALEEEKKGEAKTEDSASEKKDESAPAQSEESKNESPPADKGAEAKPEPPAAAEPRKPVAAEKPLPEFRPLDNDLRQVIQEQLLMERARAEQSKRIEAGHQFMLALADRHAMKLVEFDKDLTSDERAAEAARRVKELAPSLSAELEKFAKENQLKYVETRPVSARELYDAEEEYPIGHATEPVVNEFSNAEPATVIATLFNAPEQLLLPMRANDTARNMYVYWKVEDIAQHQPKFDDPGIREQVLTAWKRNSARPKAEERAKQLAELVRKSDAGAAEALKGQTINGKEDGPAVSVIPTTPVSWLRVTTVPSTGMMPDRRPSLSEIPGVELPDNEFMKTIFEQMKVGDVNVLPNADRSVYYVVKVKSRTPSEPSDIEAHRQAFLREDLFSGGGMFGGFTTYDYLLSPEQQQTRMAWFQQLEAKYALRRNQPLGGEKGSESARPLGS